MKLIKIILIFFIFLFSLLNIFFWVDIYFEIIYPSYLSVKMDCEIINESSLNDIGYYTAGTYSPSTNDISYFNYSSCLIETPIDKSVIIHEKCHKIEDSLGFDFSCSNPVKMYFNELICYSIDYFY